MLYRRRRAMATDLERTRRQLDKERERLAVTIESLADGLLVVEDGVVVERNPRVEELLGFIAVGTPVRDVPGLPDPLDALAGEVEVQQGRRTLAITAARLGFGSSGLVWTIRDVTERVRLESLKSAFVATASHELRSPLTSIKGFVELLHASPGLSPRQAEWVEILLVSADRLVDLVNDLLDVARIEAGRMEVHPRPTDTGEIAREVARLLQARIDAREQALVLTIDEHAPRALADPARVRQVLINLLTNAHLYTPEGGRIELRVAGGDGCVELVVADDGRGMTPEQLEHVFERFYRGGGPASPTETLQPGTGLGLAIVQSLVDLQGGTIEVDSAPGRGSTFTVRLPIAEPAALDAPGRRVLVVEGDPAAAAAIVAALAAHGMGAVVEAERGAVLARLRSEPFDAMTLDLLVDDAAGFALLRTVRAEPAPSRLPIVLVSPLGDSATLAGEWVVDRAEDPVELAEALTGAVLALLDARAG